MTAIPSFVKTAIGALAVAGLAFAGHALTGEALTELLERRAAAAIAGAGGQGMRADFTTASGWPTRHPRLTGGGALDDSTRSRVALAVASLPGVGGVRWADRNARAQSASASSEVERGPYHCQRDVEALLAVRVIRFDANSARIDPASGRLLDEVAGALRPCKGSIIAIRGHSDAVGDAAINLELSRQRARAVRSALVRRGLPRDGLRAEGFGSREPVEGLAPEDPANRRIEFDVIEIVPLQPTPIDTPDAG